ncbi:unnamed protein product [Cyprideis torosa]|uniref:Mediator of RNA polymerase II transcription subunit 24 n=1 Tax=Cyprideis torosa TaxID=163714 RepID=A0A7R8W6W9_9CRUS|nr:unnamed protein product [Cyprideis torosa]CAG0885691.1 unnamed protein product [Cyprideis torosa]
MVHTGDVKPDLTSGAFPLNNSKDSSVSKFILRAWKERWSDIQWAIQVKGIQEKTERRALTFSLLEQACVGPGSNERLLGYLKHGLATRMSTYEDLVEAFNRLKCYEKPKCVSGLLRLTRDTFHLTSAKTLCPLLHWVLVRACSFPDNEEIQKLVMTEILEKFTSSSYQQAILQIAREDDHKLTDEILQKLKQCETNNSSAVSRLITVLQNEKGTLVECPLSRRDASSPTGAYHIHHQGSPSSLHTSPGLLPYVPESNSPHSQLVFSVISIHLSDVSSSDDVMFQTLLALGHSFNMTLTDLFSEILHACFLGLSLPSSPNASFPGILVARGQNIRYASLLLFKLPALFRRLKDSLKPSENIGGKAMVELVEALDRLVTEASAMLDVADTHGNCSSMERVLSYWQKEGIVSAEDAQGILRKRVRPAPPRRMLADAMLGDICPALNPLVRAEASVETVVKALSNSDPGKNGDQLLNTLTELTAAQTLNLDAVLAVAHVQGHMQSFVQEMWRLLQSSSSAPDPSVGDDIYDYAFLLLSRVSVEYGEDCLRKLVLDKSLGLSLFPFQFILTLGSQSASLAFWKKFQRSPPWDGSSEVVSSLLHRSLRTPRGEPVHIQTGADLSAVPMVLEKILDGASQGFLSSEVLTQAIINLGRSLGSARLIVGSFLSFRSREAPLDSQDQLRTLAKEVLALTTTDSSASLRNRQALVQPILQDLLTCSLLDPVTSAGLDEPLSDEFSEAFKRCWEQGWILPRDACLLKNLLERGGPEWFVVCVLHEIVASIYPADQDKAMILALAIFYVNLDRLCLALLTDVLPSSLFSRSSVGFFTDPKGPLIAQLTVLVSYAAIGFCTKQDLGITRFHFQEEVTEEVDTPMKDEQDDETSPDAKIMKLSECLNASNDNGSGSSSGKSLNGSMKVEIGSALLDFFHSLLSVSADPKVGHRHHFLWKLLSHIPLLRGTNLLAGFVPPVMLTQAVERAPEALSYESLLSLCDLRSVLGRERAADLMRLKKQLMARNQRINDVEALRKQCGFSPSSCRGTTSPTSIDASKETS